MSIRAKDGLGMGLMLSVMWCSSSDLPNFFASTKFFACLDLLESKELFEATEMVRTSLTSSQLCIASGTNVRRVASLGSRNRSDQSILSLFQPHQADQMLDTLLSTDSSGSRTH